MSYHVLGETLAQSNVVALLHKVSGGKRIAVSIATGKALVGHVEESKVALLLHDVADLAPLLLGGVDTGGVVSAGVEKDDAVLGSSLDVGNQTLKVQTDGVLVVVTVLVDLQTRVLEDGTVVGPTGVGEVDLLGVRVEALQESSTDSQGAGTGDGLGDDETVVLEDGGIGAVGELSSSLGEGRDTGDTGVFLVETGGDNLVLGSADGGQDVGLALVITCSQKSVRNNAYGGDGCCVGQQLVEQGQMLTVSANTQVDLLGEGVGLVGLGDTQDSILRTQLISNGITTTILIN